LGKVLARLGGGRKKATDKEWPPFFSLFFSFSRLLLLFIYLVSEAPLPNERGEHLFCMCEEPVTSFPEEIASAQLPFSARCQSK
jgi:hypothetical protein